MTDRFEDAGKLGKELLDTTLASLNAVTRDAQAIADEASAYARAAFETAGETVQGLLSAPSLEKAVEMQTAYLKQAYEGLVAEATKMSGLYADMAKDAYRPFEAIVVRSK